MTKTNVRGGCNGKNNIEKQNYHKRLFSSDNSAETTVNDEDINLSSSSSFWREWDDIKKIDKRPQSIFEKVSDNLIQILIGILITLFIGFCSWVSVNIIDYNWDIKVLNSKNDWIEENINVNKSDIKEIKEDVTEIDRKVDILKVWVEKDFENINNKVVDKK